MNNQTFTPINMPSEPISFTEDEAQSFITSGFDGFTTASAPFSVHPIPQNWDFSNNIINLEKALATIKHFIASPDLAWCRDFSKDTASDKEAYKLASSAKSAFDAITHHANIRVALRGSYLYLIKVA